MSSPRRLPVAGLLATACALAFPATGRADLIVSLDTSGLPTGNTYAIDYQFSLGGPSTSNSASVYGLSYGTGGSAGPASTVQTTGSATGTLQSPPIGLSGAFAELTQNFTPGSQLKFTVGVSNSALSVGQQDTFTFGILRYDTAAQAFVDIPTANPNSNNSFLEVDTNGRGGLTVLASGSTATGFPASAPTVRAIGVPEWSGVGQLLLGLPFLSAVAWRVRSRRVDGAGVGARPAS